MNSNYKLVTDGGHDTADNGSITSDAVNIDDVSKKQLENADIDVNEVSELSKTELIALLSEAVSDDTPNKNDSDETITSKPHPHTDGEPTKTDDDREQKIIDEYASVENQVTPEEAILVKTSGDTGEKNNARKDLLGLKTKTNQNVLLIQYHPISIELLKEISDVANTVTLVMIGYTQDIPDSIRDTITIEEIDDPSDVTRLGILATGTVDEWSEYNGNVSVSVDALDEIFTQKTTEGTFRFLHIFIRKLTTLETMSHFFITESNVDKHDMNTIKTLFDDVIQIANSHKKEK